jgi:hypothetical protein
MTQSNAAALVSLATLLALPLAASAGEIPAPAAVFPPKTVEQVMGGKFKAQAPEPTVLFYNEDGGGYRTVEIYVYSGEGRGSISDFRAQFSQEGEPVEDIAGLEDAFYRPQRGEAMRGVRDASGTPILIAVSVHNAADAAATRQLAIGLVKQARLE